MNLCTSAQTHSGDPGPRLLLRLPGEGRDPFLPWAPAFAGVTEFLVAAMVHRRRMKRMKGLNTRSRASAAVRGWRRGLAESRYDTTRRHALSLASAPLLRRGRKAGPMRKRGRKF